jgi:hypothetical protein
MLSYRFLIPKHKSLPWNFWKYLGNYTGTQIEIITKPPKLPHRNFRDYSI